MYTQLYSMTVYSLLKSALILDEYIDKAKRLGMNSLAITDELNVYGLIKFYQTCVRNEIKPILGLTLLIEPNLPLILLAKSNDGYYNLLRISTDIKLSNSTTSSLMKNNKDIICIIPNINNRYVNYVNELKQYFNDNFYLGIFPEFTDNVRINNQKVKEIGLKQNIEVVALNEVRYLNKEDATTLRYLEAIDKGEKINSNRIDLFSTNQYLLEPSVFDSLFTDKVAVSNTLKIANNCNVTLDFSKFHLPKYSIPDNVSSNDYLKAICKVGLEKRLNTKQIPREYYERLKYELTIIEQMNFCDYFLIVYDFVKYAKTNKIYVGPGRGSSAGSLVSYVLGITNVDPIEYDLLFERFLNPERITMPDIDLDFQDDRRDEVIKYVQNKYGNNHVAHIISFGTFQSRSAIREVAKAMGIQDIRINQIISFIDSRLSIKDNLANSLELQKIIAEYKEINHLFQIAIKIENIPRNTTTHAAGIIICSEDLRELTGLQPSLDDVYQTQYEAKDLEALGLLKMDFLGIRNLTAISEIISLIEKTQGVTIDINNIPFNDNKTYRLIARGDTTGIFQLESAGMRQVLQDINVREFEDIVAVNALYRPGPMDNIPLFIERKKNIQKVEYLHPDLKPILESTYGIIVYQEQILKIVQKISGYSLAEADLLRRAIGKKQRDVLEKEKEIFVSRAVKNGFDQNTSETLYEYILKFGDYGFNRSHSVAYALISYQMAYLKANYITPFMTVMLSTVLGSELQTSRYIRDAKRYGINILPISINKSYNYYSIENNNSIRIAFLAIKGIGQNSGEAILHERNKAGLYKSFSDFVFRTQSFLKQNIFEALVYSGALDEFNLTKKAMLYNYNKIIDLYRFNPSGYFTDKIEIDNNFEEFLPNELMKKEKAFLGFYLSTHPVPKYLDKNKVNYVVPSQTIKYIDKNIELIGYLETIKKTITKTKAEMATIIVSDDITTINGVIFPKIYQIIKNKLSEDTLCKFKCKVQERMDKIQIVIFDLEQIEK